MKYWTVDKMLFIFKEITQSRFHAKFFKCEYLSDVSRAFQSIQAFLTFIFGALLESSISFV